MANFLIFMLKILKNDEQMPNFCERCNGALTLCPENFPWNEEFYICNECGSTYIKEINKDVQEADVKKSI
jgi:rRNA maturation endonuclease Nob1